MKITDDMLTGWFPGSEYPTRNGVYQRNFGWAGQEHPRYCKFADGEWFTFAGTIDLAAQQTLTVANHLLDWRGIKDEPSLAFEYAHKLVSQRLNKEPQRD
ncbi:hypothetical protein [Burkholderia ambifaria]|uniref:hypothetical protein n=1 Tax=Burkholderia ambifaria TaxID=152480 RepID=UPI00158B2C3A|nr:hypothetical protein [Burkholderia ambifaria]